MAGRYFCILATLCASAVVSVPPPQPQRLYQQISPQSLQNLASLDYFMDGPEPQYYQQPLQKQARDQNSAPARLETLEPDSEVELIPGAQQPQQPPQQAPAAPGNGLVPGRVFIVHMPVPGYRPGTIGGYQPVYVVAAGPQGNMAYAPNGYQNVVLLNPSGQVVSPFLGYPGLQQPIVGPNSGLVNLIGGAPLQYTREYEQQAYQGPQGPHTGAPAFNYGPPGPQGASQSAGSQGPQKLQGQVALSYTASLGPHGGSFLPQGGPFGLQGGPFGPQGPGALQFSQLVQLQGQQQRTAEPNGLRSAASSESSSNAEQKRGEASAESTESKESEGPRRNARPAPSPPARNKA